ncbi:MAG: class I SAM-dependent methyltransferase [Planctomycetes bacterium]|nr:class I SAM-dependent methyltransferase [Planctomycetota bacterium]
MTTAEPERSTDPIVSAPTAPTVVACYSVFDRFFPACGFTDLTDGIYEGDTNRSYEAAQARQAEVLLDRAEVWSASRLLDIGCGYGRILKAATNRGAKSWGLTVSPEQVRRNTKAGLDTRLQNYKHLGPEWHRQFDAVIANGSLEHFAQPADAVAGRDDAIYQHLFATVHRLLDPEVVGAKFVTTAIHLRERPDPRNWLRPPSHFQYGSAEFHWARLARSFGGWYPVIGQLERCAEGYFRLVHEEDGTDDYRITSEACLTAVRRIFRSWRLPQVGCAALPVLVRRPVHTIRMLRCMLGSESWNWQFRGDQAPTVLLRQTWERVA